MINLSEVILSLLSVYLILILPGLGLLFKKEIPKKFKVLIFFHLISVININQAYIYYYAHSNKKLDKKEIANFHKGFALHHLASGYFLRTFVIFSLIAILIGSLQGQALIYLNLSALLSVCSSFGQAGYQFYVNKEVEVLSNSLWHYFKNSFIRRMPVMLFGTALGPYYILDSFTRAMIVQITVLKSN